MNNKIEIDREDLIRWQHKLNDCSNWLKNHVGSTIINELDQIETEMWAWLTPMDHKNMKFVPLE